MQIPTTKAEAQELLNSYVNDSYQRLHAEMVAEAMAGYARLWKEDEFLWWLTGYLHDIDYEQYPEQHPGPSLKWFKESNFNDDLIHAVEAHALGFNGFTTEPSSLLAKSLLACDEICGIFYAYQRLNPLPYGEMKVSSIIKRLKESKFAPGISRDHIYEAIARLDITIEDHVTNLISSLSRLPFTPSQN